MLFDLFAGSKTTAQQNNRVKESIAKDRECLVTLFDEFLETIAQKLIATNGTGLVTRLSRCAIVLFHNMRKHNKRTLSFLFEAEAEELNFRNVFFQLIRAKRNRRSSAI